MHSYLRDKYDEGFLWWDFVHLADFGQDLLPKTIQRVRTNITLIDGTTIRQETVNFRREADSLDNHPECSIYFYSFSNLDEKGKGEYSTPGLKTIYVLKELLLRNFIGSSNHYVQKWLIW